MQKLTSLEATISFVLRNGSANHMSGYRDPTGDSRICSAVAISLPGRSFFRRFEHGFANRHRESVGPQVQPLPTA
jgi:hypothetical protein